MISTEVRWKEELPEEFKIPVAIMLRGMASPIGVEAQVAHVVGSHKTLVAVIALSPADQGDIGLVGGYMTYEH